MLTGTTEDINCENGCPHKESKTSIVMQFEQNGKYTNVPYVDSVSCAYRQKLTFPCECECHDWENKDVDEYSAFLDKWFKSEQLTEALAYFVRGGVT